MSVLHDMNTHPHTSHTITLRVSAYDGRYWHPIPWESADHVYTCPELSAAVRTAGRVAGTILRPALAPAFRVEVRDVAHRWLIALSEYRPTWEPGRTWAPASAWTACESGLCVHGQPPDRVTLAA